MKIELICIGKNAKNYLEDGVSEYAERIKRYINFEVVYIKDIKSTKNTEPEFFKEKEGELILSRLSENDYVVLLDSGGKMFNSNSFAEFIETKISSSKKRMVFIIGGAFGFSEEVYKRADFKISLSTLTFSHQPVRILFLEQLYRAFTILKNEPYHK